MKFFDWLYLKAHGICPKHFVQKSVKFGCSMCCDEWRKEHHDRVKRIMEER